MNINLRPNKIHWLLLLVLYALITLIAFQLKRCMPVFQKPSDVAVKVAPIKALTHASAELVTVKKPVKVYAETAFKNGLKLPAEVSKSQSIGVISSSDIASDLRPQRVTTVLDTDTGEVSTYLSKEPLPWFQMRSSGELGLYGGVMNGTPGARLQLKQDLFQVKAMRCGGLASLDQPATGAGSNYFLGAGCALHWQ